MRALALAAIAAAGCIDFSPGNSGGDGDNPDAAVDAEPTCDVTSRYPIMPCPVNSTDLVLDTTGIYTLDTTSGELRDPAAQLVTALSVIVSQLDGSEALAVRAQTISVNAGATLRVAGRRALYLVASSNIFITGAIEVGAAGVISGPNVRNDCDGAAGINDGGGGGAGGRDIGGDGGNAVGGGTGGSAALFDGSIARAGCLGGAGGTSCGAGAEGGGGGGAIVLIAANELRVSGSIDASGGGGRGALGPAPCGGAGGGSGGTIGLEAAAITVTGELTAAGGGGGGRATNAGAGDDGSDGRLNSLGGLPNGGAGGRVIQPGDGGDSTSGGGGGGGAAGAIFITVGADLDNATIIPASDPA